MPCIQPCFPTARALPGSWSIDCRFSLVLPVMKYRKSQERFRWAMKEFHVDFGGVGKLKKGTTAVCRVSWRVTNYPEKSRIINSIF